MHTNQSANSYRITSLSTRSVLVSFGNIVDQSTNEKVLSLHQSLLQSAFEGFIESVPAYASLAVFFEVQKIRQQAGSTAFGFVKKFLEDLLPTNSSMIEAFPPVIKVPVCYHPHIGIDITQLADSLLLTVEELINLHVSVIYRVYMMGFMPGFAYMGTLPDKLIAPRKEQPRLQVHAGSVGIAGSQTGIYPIDSPGGWNIIGRTPLVLFDPYQSSPCLFSAGDLVQFISINKTEFDQYHVH